MNSVYRIFSDRYGVKYTQDELIQCIDYFTYSEKTPFIFTDSEKRTPFIFTYSEKRTPFIFTYSEKRTPFIFTVKEYNINNDVIYNLLLQASFHVTINLCKTSKSAYKNSQ